MDTPRKDLTILEEVWENQRYRLIGWTRPFPLDGGFQGFGDRLGDTCYSKDRFPELSPPPGWAWIDQEWVLDVNWADVDDEGWCYAPSFSALKEQLLVGAVSASKTSSDFVRRRRWTRRRKCEEDKAKEEWDKYLEHLGQRQEAEQKRLRRRETCFEEVLQFEVRRAEAAESVFRKADHELLAQGCKLAESFDLLLALKVLLKRRSQLDRRYSTALYNFLSRFGKRPGTSDLPEGINLATPDEVEGEDGATQTESATSTAGSSNQPAEPLYAVEDEVTDDALQLQQGFSDGVSVIGNMGTFSTLWDQMGGDDVLQPQWLSLKCLQDFSNELESLVVRADHLINEMGDAMQSCADMRRHLKSRLSQREEECRTAWKAYNATYDTLCLDSANRVQKIRLILNDPAQLMNARRTDTEADVGDAGKGPDKTDLWVAENSYRNAASASMNACLGLAKSIPRILLRVTELDGAASFLIKTGGRQFLHRQLRMYKTIADSFSGGQPADEAAIGDAKEEDPEQAKLRLETLMKEASERARIFSAESIESSLPALDSSKLVVRAALAQRYTLESTDVLFSKSLQNQHAEGGEKGDEGEKSSEPRPGFSKSAVLVILTVDGFLHIFDADNSTFDPERIANRGPQLSLDVRPHVKGVEVADSNVAPNALRVRGALQRSIFRLSTGGLFDVVLADWSPNLFPLAVPASPEDVDTSAGKDGWKQLILHPLVEFGLPAAIPPQPGKLVLLSAPNSFDAEGETDTGVDYTDLLVSFGSRSGSEDVDTGDNDEGQHEDGIPEKGIPANLDIDELLVGSTERKVTPRRRLVPVDSTDGPSDLELLMDPFSGSMESTASTESPEAEAADTAPQVAETAPPVAETGQKDEAETGEEVEAEPLKSEAEEGGVVADVVDM